MSRKTNRLRARVQHLEGWNKWLIQEVSTGIKDTRRLHAVCIELKAERLMAENFVAQAKAKLERDAILTIRWDRGTPYGERMVGFRITLFPRLLLLDGAKASRDLTSEIEDKVHHFAHQLRKVLMTYAHEGEAGLTKLFADER